MAKKIETLRVKPVFMDGLTTYKTYLVLATNPSNPTFNCVAVRRFSDGQFKLKFYPNAEAWGFSVSGLEARGLSSHLNRKRSEGCGGTHTYDRFMAESSRQANSILNTLRENQDYKVVTPENMAKVLENWGEAQDDCIYVQEEENIAA